MVNKFVCKWDSTSKLLLLNKKLGEENAVKYKRIGWSIASGSAEIIADCLLCPFEAIKVRM